MKTLLFDVDGVLVDSEKIYNSCWVRAAKESGYNLSSEQAMNLRSLDSVLASEFFFKLFHDRNAYPLIRQRRKEIMKNVTDGQLKAKPGVQELMEYLNAEKINYAVVTASPVSRAMAYLESAKIGHYFPEIISTEHVQRGKPYPDIYEFACRKLSLVPRECAAVEDSPNGLMSAHDAGCITIMIPDISPYDDNLKGYVDYCFACPTDIISSGVLRT